VGQQVQPPEIVSVKGPVVFLAGPVQGAPRWQPEATARLLSKSPLVNVANPFGTDTAWAQQWEWEAHYLQVADVILFWLPKEIQHECSRAYAQTSRFELGEWMARGGPLVVGIEPGFVGEDYIRYRLGASRPDVVVCQTLPETCDAALHQIE
jgi:hypothetical protein